MDPIIKILSGEEDSVSKPTASPSASEETSEPESTELPSASGAGVGEEAQGWGSWLSSLLWGDNNSD
jgi:hypothetical protein